MNQLSSTFSFLISYFAAPSSTQPDHHTTASLSSTVILLTAAASCWCTFVLLLPRCRLPSSAARCCRCWLLYAFYRSSMSCAATQSRKDEGKKDSGVADTKPEQQEQEIKRTAPLPINIPTASFSKPLSSHVSASPASSPLRSLSLLPAKASSLSPSSSGAAHRSLGSWRHVDGRANAKSAVAARSVCLLHSPLTSSGSIKADGGASQSQSVRWSQDVRQVSNMT